MAFGHKFETSGGANYLKLKDGDKVPVLFRGEDVAIVKHWVGNKTSDCTGSRCDACADGIKRSERFKINVVVKENGAYVAKIFEGPGSLYSTIQALLEEGHPLTSTVFKLCRKGSGLNTEWSVLTSPQLATADVLAQVDRVKLHDLTTKKTGPTVHDEPSAFDDSDRIPF